MKITHALEQGSDQWRAFRRTKFGASEAAAMLGLSPKVKRNELLAMRATGLEREFSDWVQQNILDPGHEVEALARPIVEAQIGEDLYAMTFSDGPLSASVDGITADDSLVWEHKQHNAELAAYVHANDAPPEEHMPQCQQILLVSGAKELLFTVSDGTEQKMVSCCVAPDPAWFERIRAGWVQFEKDLINYRTPEPVVQAVAASMDSLPAVSVHMGGSLAVQTNLPAFGLALKAFIERIPKAPGTDDEFATTEAACKALKKAEDALEAAESGALASMADVEAMRRMVSDFRNLARATRLASEKLVETRKAAIRAQVVAGAQQQLDAHVLALNVRLGSPWIPRTVGGFNEAIKGKRTIESLRDAVDTELANTKISLNATSDLLFGNRQSLVVDGTDWFFLFADFASLGNTPKELFAAVAAQRIQRHKEAEAAKQAAKAPAVVLAAAVLPAPVSAPAQSSKTEQGGRPPITTGTLCDRLGFVVTAQFIERLGFTQAPRPVTAKAGNFWNASDFPLICNALVLHIQAAAKS